MTMLDERPSVDPVCICGHKESEHEDNGWGQPGWCKHRLTCRCWKFTEKK